MDNPIYKGNVHPIPNPNVAELTQGQYSATYDLAAATVLRIRVRHQPKGEIQS